MGSQTIFVLLWSAEAGKSDWVDLEVTTFAQRAARESALRLVPVRLDDTPLSEPIRDRVALSYEDGQDAFKLALEILGRAAPDDVQLASVLQRRIVELTESNRAPRDPMPYLVCPGCESAKLRRGQISDDARDAAYYLIECDDCGWGDWSE